MTMKFAGAPKEFWGRWPGSFNEIFRQVAGVFLKDHEKLLQY